MTTDHDSEDGKKTYYSPLEAAVRLSGLFRHEKDIQALVGDSPWPGQEACARWPGLHFHLSRLRDALLNSELACCKAGVTCRGEPLPLDDPGLSIRHIELRRWIESFYPEECPAFLFGEKYVPQTISNRACQVLRAELQAKSIELTRSDDSLKAIREEHGLLIKKHQLLTSKYEQELRQDEAPYRRRVSTLLGIIEALESFLIKSTISEKLSLPFRTQDSLIKALLKHFPKRPGMSERNLRAKLADAKKLVKDTS